MVIRDEEYWANRIEVLIRAPQTKASNCPTLIVGRGTLQRDEVEYLVYETGMNSTSD